MVYTCPCDHSLRNRDGRIPRAYWPAGLPTSMNSRSSGRPCLKTQVERHRGTASVDFQPPHTCSHICSCTCTCLLTHICTGTHTHGYSKLNSCDSMCIQVLRSTSCCSTMSPPFCEVSPDHVSTILRDYSKTLKKCISKSDHCDFYVALLIWLLCA